MKLFTSLNSRYLVSCSSYWWAVQFPISSSTIQIESYFCIMFQADTCSSYTLICKLFTVWYSESSYSWCCLCVYALVLKPWKYLLNHCKGSQIFGFIVTMQLWIITSMHSHISLRWSALSSFEGTFLSRKPFVGFVIVNQCCSTWLFVPLVDYQEYQWGCMMLEFHYRANSQQGNNNY